MRIRFPPRCFNISLVYFKNIQTKRRCWPTSRGVYRNLSWGLNLSYNPGGGLNSSEHYSFHFTREGTIAPVYASANKTSHLYLNTLLVCLFFLCPINVKRLNQSGPNFSWNLRFLYGRVFVLVLYCTKRRCSQTETQLEVDLKA